MASRLGRSAAVVIAIALGGGCASSDDDRIEWVKPGGSQVELQRALDACEAISGVKLEDIQGAEAEARALRGPFTSCMRDRGWVWGVSDDA